MLSTDERSRYSKHIILPEIGVTGQERLKAARVAVVGAGGLGCPILQYLTAAGVGTIAIIDGDEVSISNLQRQILYTEQEIGQKKALIAAQKLSALNPNVTFQPHTVFLDSANALSLLQDFDLVIDGSDNFATRYLVNDACVILNKPFVSGAIYRFEGQLSVFNYNNGPTYRCLFPEPPGEGESPNCADIGVIATLPGIVGTMQANEAMKIITQAGDVLSGKLLTVNVLDMSMHTFSFSLHPANKNIIKLAASNDGNCAVSAKVQEITYEELRELLQKEEVQLIDVRETEEHEIGNIGGVNVPLSTLAERFGELQPSGIVVAYCSSGTRSRHFARQLLQKGFRRVFNLANGINALNLR